MSVGTGLVCGLQGFSIMIFERKVAIVTGAGRGIGRAVAVALGRNGCQMSVAARSIAQREAVP